MRLFMSRAEMPRFRNAVDIRIKSVKVSLAPCRRTHNLRISAEFRVRVALRPLTGSFHHQQRNLIGCGSSSLSKFNDDNAATPDVFCSIESK